MPPTYACTVDRAGARSRKRNLDSLVSPGLQRVGAVGPRIPPALVGNAWAIWCGLARWPRPARILAYGAGSIGGALRDCADPAVAVRRVVAPARRKPYVQGELTY